MVENIFHLFQASMPLKLILEDYKILKWASELQHTGVYLQYIFKFGLIAFEDIMHYNYQSDKISPSLQKILITCFNFQLGLLRILSFSFLFSSTSSSYCTVIHACLFCRSIYFWPK